MVPNNIANTSIKMLVRDSPFVLLSVGTSLWIFLRQTAPSLVLASGPPSPLDVTGVALIGIGAGLAGLLRKNERGWYICPLAIIANCLCWWYVVSRIDSSSLYQS